MTAEYPASVVIGRLNPRPFPTRHEQRHIASVESLRNDVVSFAGARIHIRDGDNYDMLAGLRPGWNHDRGQENEENAVSKTSGCPISPRSWEQWGFFNAHFGMEKSHCWFESDGNGSPAKLASQKASLD